MKRKSLRIQITAAVGIIVALACLIVTVNSIYSANSHYVSFFQEQVFSDDGTEPPPGTYQVDKPGENEQVVEDITRSFSVQGVGVMVLTILAAIFFTWWACGRLLGPLEELSGKIRTVDQGKLNQPLSVSEGTAEVRMLAESFNGMLERLNRSFQMQRHFAADAAHELKTPLAAMKTSLQVLQMDGVASVEEYQEFVQDTEDSLERLIRTVENLLALSASESGQEREPVPLMEITGNAAKSLYTKAQAHGVSVSVEGEDLTVLGSPHLFYRAVYNVLDNAIKYNRPGGEVLAKVVRKDAGRAAVEISDTGIGIPPESLGSVFEPFYRADPSRSQKIEGSGLGLSIVRQIMEQYGGSVFVESSAETGSTVTLTFP